MQQHQLQHFCHPEHPLLFNPDDDRRGDCCYGCRESIYGPSYSCKECGGWNFYWLHLSGGDYKLLEPYRRKKIPLKITSKVFIKGSTYEIEMHVENVAKRADSRSLTYMNNFTAKQGNGDFDMALGEPATSGTDQKHEVGLFQRIFRCSTKENGSLKVTEVNGADVGVAFFLHFSVHALKTDHKEGEDTRILPVHYSDNYFSLVPGEVMPIKITFKVPLGVTPRVTLHGWNYHGRHTVH